MNWGVKLIPVAQGDLVDDRRNREALSGYSGLSNCLHSRLPKCLLL